MMKIKNFVDLMTGEFDNKEQFMEMKEAGKSFPYAQHKSRHPRHHGKR